MVRVRVRVRARVSVMVRARVRVRVTLTARARFSVRDWTRARVSVSSRCMWGTVPRMGNVAQPSLGKASGEQGWQAGPTSMDRFSCGKSGLHCTLTAMRLALAKTPSP